jgi:ribonuclease HI
VWNTPYGFKQRASTATLITDASEPGWAAALFANGARFHTFGFWSVTDSSFTSNQRETSAVLRGLTYFRRLLKHFGVKAMTVRSDNAATVCNL